MSKTTIPAGGITDGTLTSAKLDQDGAFTFNEDSASVDFRVESNGDANCLIVDGSSDKVGIGEDVPEAKLHIMTGDASVGPNAQADELVVEGSAHTGISILSGNDDKGNIYFGDSGDDDIGSITYHHDGNSMRLTTNASERIRITSDGDFLLAKTSADAGSNGGEIRNNGMAVFTRSGDNPLILNRNTDDGRLVDFKGQNSTEGEITVSGSTVSYNAFAGSHWSRLADNSQPTILRGTVMESIATMCDWYKVKFDINQHDSSKDKEERTEEIALPDGKSVGDTIKHTFQEEEYDGVIEKQDNERLPMCKISDTEDSKAVYGVFMMWDNQPDDGVNDMYVTALGAFVVRIHKDETVAIGDYLQSKGDGTAKKQADDILRASTIAKVISTEKTHEYADGSYCVPCTLHCG